MLLVIMLNVIMVSVIKLSAVRLSVIMLIVVARKLKPKNEIENTPAYVSTVSVTKDNLFCNIDT